jgi:transcription-repair coupling factor (superfamily II helicase)
MEGRAFLSPPSAQVLYRTSARHAVCARRPRSRPTAASAVTAATAAAPPAEDDDFFLPALDIQSLANNTVLGGDSARKKKSADDAPPTVAQQRLHQKLKKAAQQQARDSEHDFMQAARDAIAMAEIPTGTAGVADVSVADGDTSTTAVQDRGGSHAPRLGNLSIPGSLFRSESGAEFADGDGFDIEIQASDLVPLASAATSRTPPTSRAPREDGGSVRATEAGDAGGGGGAVSPIARLPEFVIRPRDLVMHSRHGVGRFRGLERTSSSQGPTQEYAVVEYRDGDVYVPLSQLDALRRLPEDQERAATALDAVTGAATFSDGSDASNMRSRRAKYNARLKARAKIREQLVNLHGLYAAREAIVRPKYVAYPEEEATFVSRCEFDLTPDQRTAVSEVLSDMSDRSRPMDRLLCGDVGFGKTEVAVRAAFRVLMAGRQVAVLAPTTILAQQHLETFRQRFEELYPQFPVACLTRFLARKCVLETRERVKTGEARIVIGTHILLGDATQFKNLGLLIVDEEHRFGVNQKEKLRCKHRDVDTLFMSATPIPRTLHLALSGLRDTSILKQPPPGRKPVITRVAASGSGVVRRALAKEFERGGQVFFVCPRIEGIEATASWVRDLFPATRVLVAHGSHKDLERRIWAFSNGDYDVLVCTSIIENGINMPRVNTMVVQDAARFGMAQLHQLRGRVGRCDLQAFAWLLYTKRPGGDSVPAHERLRALERFSGLGAGFAIAQRDMEMRGVGTVLGVDQHGNSSMDVEDYSRMLVEELEAAKTGNPVPMTLPGPVDSTEVFLPVASFIPPDYVADGDEKMGLYRLMAGVATAQELAAVASDMERRYGPLPIPVHRHVCIMRLKLLAKRLGIRRILVERQHVVLDWAIGGASLQRLVSFLEDKQARVRFEAVEAEEKVNLRGLGVCTGDLQLAKLLKWLDVFDKASADFKNGANAGDTVGEHDKDMLVGMLQATVRDD